MRLLALAALATLSTAHAEPRRDPVELRLGTMAIDGSRYMKDILALSRDIEKRTRGMVVLSWSSGGQLGDDTAMAGLVADGTLDGAGLADAGLVALVPELAAWRTPGLFRDDADVDRAITAFDDDTRARFAKRGLVFAMWADLGFAHLFTTGPERDLALTLERAGDALAMPLDATLTHAIAKRAIGAWAVPPLYMLALGTTGVRTMTTLPYRHVIGGLVFSQAAWSRLSPDEQATVLDVCRTWQPKIRASWRKESQRAIAALAKAGVAVRAPSDAELAAFRASLPKPSGLAAKLAR